MHQEIGPCAASDDETFGRLAASSFPSPADDWNMHIMRHLRTQGDNPDRESSEVGDTVVRDPTDRHYVFQDILTYLGTTTIVSPPQKGYGTT